MGDSVPSSTFSASSAVSDLNSTKAETTDASSTPSKKLKLNDGSQLSSSISTVYERAVLADHGSAGSTSSILPTKPEGT